MMVHQQHHRFPQLRKGDVEEAKQQDSQEAQAILDDYCTKKTNPRLLSILIFFSLISCSLVFAPRFSNIPFSYFENEGALKPIRLPCTASTDSNCIYCDRTGYRSDICFMRGDIRTHSSDSSIFLFSSNNLTSPEDTHVQKIKPYTRKWEKSVMDTIEEIKLVETSLESETQEHACKVTHAVPAVFFSTGGYTGNVYHEFNDGIIPLYITSKKYNKKVVFVISEYHEWWITKYGDILARLSDYPPIDFSKDPSTHCFSEAVIGLNIHDELSVDPTMMPHYSTVQEFRDLLDKAYEPRIRSLIQEEEETQPKQLVQEEPAQPKLVLLSRHGSRAVLNEPQVVKLAEEIGFRVEVLKPEPTTELAKIYRALNGSDVMAGVHGAAMTHFLFMRPGSVFIQVVPLGTEWAAETYYGGPAEKLGLKYVGYKIRPGESSLARKYKMDDPVLTDPVSVNKRGWEVTKRVYLDGQDVTLDLGRLKRRLTRVYWYCVNKRRRAV